MLLEQRTRHRSFHIVFLRQTIIDDPMDGLRRGFPDRFGLFDIGLSDYFRQFSIGINGYRDIGAKDQNQRNEYQVEYLGLDTADHELPEFSDDAHDYCGYESSKDYESQSPVHEDVHVLENACMEQPDKHGRAYKIDNGVDQYQQYYAAGR